MSKIIPPYTQIWICILRLKENPLHISHTFPPNDMGCNRNGSDKGCLPTWRMSPLAMKGMSMLGQRSLPNSLPFRVITRALMMFHCLGHPVLPTMRALGIVPHLLFPHYFHLGNLNLVTEQKINAIPSIQHRSFDLILIFIITPCPSPPPFNHHRSNWTELIQQQQIPILLPYKLSPLLSPLIIYTGIH